ncbi:MAG: hypothetical protein KAT30_04595, partial [Candidatus Krumholzibacteria bacterium]|nr:hypothetical protein [Candidatus Krumholzibacteria bacterium]
VGDKRALEVEVVDDFGNAVPNEPVRYLVTGAPDGSAMMSTGIVWTDALGRAVDTLRTAVTAGDNVVDVMIDGPPPPLDNVTFVVSTIAGGIAYYEVETDRTQQTAGMPVNVTVRAYDGSDNLVDDDSTTPVELFLSEGVGWGPLFSTLEAGTLQTTVVDIIAETIRFRAQTQGNPLIFGESGQVDIVPDDPAGVITAVAVEDTIAANGSSTSIITSGVIWDQYGNQVPVGELITLVESDGTIISADESGLPRIQRSVQTDGRIVFELRSSTTPGTANVTMTSVSGTPPAFGAVDVEFAPRPNIVDAGPLSPNAVIIGQNYAFSVPVQNQSTTRVLLNTGTLFEFSDGTSSFSAALAAPKSIAGSAIVTLVFEPTQIPGSMTPDWYRPTLEL